ncbi:uncharacterized protein LOC115402792 isoform X2 [Salarias fasciatus]|uniref:uncharacterized protein LOC115402792 isoform X2 n=1 Tax=Salarias fasciatus TaxID=181472 RepID=UPI001177078E|nr:zinc finger protein 654 isoform X2 [Salarias fasciatus]
MTVSTSTTFSAAWPCDFFELMLFFSKEEFVEEPLKNILDSFQECHIRLLRHRNIYLQHVKQIIKAGGPWENPVLQGILKEAKLSPTEIEDYLSSELTVFFELRVRYLQACERMQEAMALAKSCLESRETGKHLYFHQAYLTCLYKASLYENLHKEMAEIDGRDAVEIICNTESVEKDELLLSLCKTFLTQQLHNGDMYYIWDLVFIWSRLHLRAHPSREGFLAECLQLASSATNVRAIFPFIKLVTSELGSEGVQVCVELCARALQLCEMQADAVTQSLVYKTIAFLLPHDLEICRACALLVFCQERSLEAYRTVCSLYMHPDQEPHPHNDSVRTSVRFHILQMLKERLCFDPEFWNLLTLRNHCLELINDQVMKAAVLNEMKEEEEKEYNEELVTNSSVNSSCTHDTSHNHTEEASAPQNPPQVETNQEAETKCVSSTNNAPLRRRNWRSRLRKRKRRPLYDEDIEQGDDPEISYNFKSTPLSNKPIYSLRRNHSNTENSPSVTLPLSRKREYLSRCVKSQILKRKGRKRWLQGVPRLEQVQTFREKIVVVKGKKRGRKPLSRLDLSYPDNEIPLPVEEWDLQKTGDSEDTEHGPHPEDSVNVEAAEDKLEVDEKGNEEYTESLCSTNISDQESQTASACKPENLSTELEAAVEASPELDGPPLELLDCPVELLHTYSVKSKTPESENPPESPEPDELNGSTEEEPQPEVETKVSETEIQVQVKKSWRDRVLRTQQYAHITYHCNFCQKDYKGLNVLRHVLSHLKSRRLKCILCGKRFQQPLVAKKHVLEHIEAMSKEKPPDEKPCSEEKPAANGTTCTVKNHTPSVEEEQKPVIKVKVSSLKREERIIRNLRTLIKKTSVLHKKCKNPDTNLFRNIDFTDEQVVIADGLVIVRAPTVVKEEEEEHEEDGEENSLPTRKNGYDLDVTYHLCPSDSCDRVFLRISSTLTKHAIKCHIDEDKVLEKTFVWAKHKCTLCYRQIQFLQHYKDHMKLHNAPLQHFCYHLGCEQRFASQQELKDHAVTHQPFRPRCTFADCGKIFASLQCLHDHEWRHYIPAPQKEELDVGSRQNSQSDEAPWKQRVKVEQLWLQNKKGPTESPAIKTEPSDMEYYSEAVKTERQDSEISAQERSPIPFQPDNCLEKTDDHENTHASKTTINGHEAVTTNVPHQSVSAPLAHSSSTTPTKKARKKTPELDPINIRDLEDLSTLAEGISQNIAEPHITEHKSFKPEDPSYATFVKAPFTRPPPSTYLDESLLSMRKRRTDDEPPPKKYLSWSQRKKKEPDPVQPPQGAEESPEKKVRQRCEKCLDSFSSSEELQKHQSQNKCSSFFGFDSDDES